jgi:SsrA-binding protein
MNSQIKYDNRKARHEYEILETWTAGISLMGSEVKAIRAGHLDFTGAWCDIQNEECFCRDLYIKEVGVAFTHPERRVRRLLLTKKEIMRIDKMMDKGLTMIPLSIWTSEKGFIKLTIALAKGKKNWDKRNSIKERDLKRISDRF